MKKKQNGELNFLRFAFSIIILIFHWNLTFNYGIVKNGNIGVEFFFILNGFFMCRSAEKQSLDLPPYQIADTTWRFLMDKIKKFFPYYICVILVQLLVRDILIRDMSIRMAWEELYKSIPTFSLTFMVLNYKSVSLYVGNTWYLSSMLVVMMMLYPLLLKSYHNHSKITIPLICIFTLGYLYYTNNSIMVWESWAGICYYATLRAMSEIAFGICVYGIYTVIINKFGKYSGNITLRIFFTLIKCLCYYFVFRFVFSERGSSENLHVLLWIGIGIALSYSELGYSIPDSKLTRYFAKLALPIFIFHGFMRYAVRDIIGSGPVSGKMFWGLVFGSLILSILLMYLTDFINTYLKRLMKRLIKPSTP